MSHHSPIDYDRTFRIGRARFCVRCCGVTLGAALVIISSLMFNHQSRIGLVVLFCILTPLPAAVDFVCNELKYYNSNNCLRFITGLLLGIPPGISVFYLVKGDFAIPILTFIWYFFLEMIIAYIFKRRDYIEEYIRKYSSAVNLNSSEK